MNRRDLIRHLANMNCELLREGGNHAIYVNPQTGHRAPVPRHREIDKHIVKRIYQQLGVRAPTK